MISAIEARPRASALAAYALGSFVFFVRPVLSHPRVTCICYGGANPDPTLFMWGFAWWPKALTFAHGNPFVSHSIFYPHGANLAHTTSAPGPAVALFPVTALLGPVFAYDVAIALVPVLGAFAAFLLCRELTGRFWPSLVGGWLFGFSQYELSAMTAHLHLALVFCVPLVAYLVVRRVRGRLGRNAFIALAALVLLAQVSISTEVFASLTAFGAVALALAVFVWPERRAAVGQIAVELALAYAAVAVLAAPYLWYAVTGGGPRGIASGPISTDLLGPIVPTVVDKVGGIHFAYISERFKAGWGEGPAYLGLPLLVIAAVYAWMARRDRIAHFLTLVVVAPLVLSFGAKLYVEGNPTIPMPWALVDHLPLVRGALPGRFFLYVTLVASVACALWLARPRRNWALPAAVAVVAAVALVPNTGYSFWFKRMDIPPLIDDGGWRAFVHAGEVALVLPHTSTGKAMLWQAWTKIGFRMAGGYFGYNWNDPDAREPIYPYFRDQRLVYGANAFAPFRDYLTRHRVNVVFVDAVQAGPWPQYLAALGWRRRDARGLMVYRRA